VRAWLATVALAALLLAACEKQAPLTAPPPPPLSVTARSIAAPPSAAARTAQAPAVAPAAPAAPCGMPAELLARGWRTELSPTSASEAPPFVPGTTTLIALPDIQYYSSCASPHFAEQVRWAVREKAHRNIPAVVTLGDLTDKNTRPEWEYVRSGLAPGQDELPFVLVTGNHDHGDRGTSNRRGSLLEQYFPTAPGAAAKALAETEAPGDIENAYYRIRLAKVTLGVLALEWSPRKATLAWANQVLSRHAGDRVIVLTHAYLYNDGTRYDWKAKGEHQEWNPRWYSTANSGDAADGEMIWNDLVKRHVGIFLVLSGHVLGSGVGVLSSRTSFGSVVHQVVVNYQMLKDGGLGYLRLLELLPDGKTLRMKSFSPTLGLFATGPDQTGELPLEPPLW